MPRITIEPVSMNGIEIRLANLEDQSLIEAVPAGVFDYDIKPGDELILIKEVIAG